MAGHSKWANTKHRKAAQDAKRGKIFTKIIRELSTATKLGGADPITNTRLRAAIDKALCNNRLLTYGCQQNIIFPVLLSISISTDSQFK